MAFDLFQRASRVSKAAWEAWRTRVRYSNVARKALVKIAFKVQVEVLAQWKACAAEMKEKKAKVRHFPPT